MKINLNNHIKVKLTAEGKEIYRRQFDEVNPKYWPSTTEPEVDEDGYTSMQLWVFMNLYGSHLSPGLPQIVERMEIEILENGDEYKKGAQDAWELVRNLFNKRDFLDRLFNDEDVELEDVINCCDIEELLQKAKECDTSHNFQVGDQVIPVKHSDPADPDFKVGIVTKLAMTDPNRVYVTWSDGYPTVEDVCKVKETGRNLSKTLDSLFTL